MGIFKNIFTWWEGSTFGTWLLASLINSGASFLILGG